MEFEPPLIEGVLQRRYKRFLADVELADRTTLTVHCPNTGAMTGCAEPGSRVWLSTSPNPKRKYPHTLEIVESSRGMVGVNPSLANALVEEAVTAGAVTPLSGYARVRREVRAPDGTSRFDLMLSEGSSPDAYVEVKSLTLCEDDGLGYFPDAVSLRARKHLHALRATLDQGCRAVLVFCVQHTGVREARAAAQIDADYAQLLDEVASAGVEVLALACRVAPAGISVSGLLPFRGQGV